MPRMQGRRCVVTGGGRGIGRAIALAFAQEGADVAVVDRLAGQAEAVAAEVRALGVAGFAFAADVSDEASITAALTAAEESLGRVDVLMNNAGISTHMSFVDMPVAVWDEMIAVNLRSVFLGTRVVLPGMMRRRFGRIISTSSQLAHKGGRELTHYAAAKAGVLGFTRSLAYEVAPYNITVNAICPGPINTDMTRGGSAEWKQRKLAELPLGRYGEVGEIAPTAVLIASDEGSYYTGASFNPNGGDVML
ncbi:SDR family NAD(P)-dependent oxidoreductase [Paracraurococcus lichenis]|uniref:SDR family oxidoreductase n=1 Tax=Paracraurococcus lichenis TaxID=3064888 RepID=A0ABT9E2L6_9PROT|nr:SDR family oxidoreductase [Paracraurococcus sp. LOR1-02]MDO9710406.1 SDR family oxidoreductase [Paracraurococcus sp. LOR1-02]